MLWIFDLDGTIYYPVTPVEKAVVNRMRNFFSTRLGIPVDEYEALRLHLKQKHRTEYTLQAFCREYGWNFDEVVKECYLTVSYKDIGIQPTPGLQTIQELPGEKWILTNAPVAYAKTILQQVGVREVFTRILGLGETESFTKPHPEAYQRVQHHGPIIMIEDTPANLHIPKELGWTTVLLILSDKMETPPTYVDMVINDLSELHKLARRLNRS